MIALRREPIIALQSELQPLLEAHYEELTLHKEVAKLKPRWGRYIELDEADAFAIFTARDTATGNLVGYSAFFIAPHMHYEGLVLAANDVLYIHPDYRAGPTALRLLRYAEPALKALGAHKIAYHAKLSNRLIEILVRMEYDYEEAVLGKVI